MNEREIKERQEQFEKECRKGKIIGMVIFPIAILLSIVAYVIPIKALCDIAKNTKKN